MSPRWTPDPNIRRGRSVVFNLHVHLVFVTKYRRDVLNDPILTRCEQIMRDVCAGMGAELREFNGADDHVHLLVHYPPKLAISTLVNSLKASPRTTYARNSPAGSTGTSCTDTYGPRPTSPPPAAGLHSQWSRSTSQTRNVPVRDAIPPGPERPGFPANDVDTWRQDR